MTFLDLYNLIAERKKTMPIGSGTTSLLSAGLDKILPKLNEEAFEVALALESEGPDQVALETSQCFYYLMCLSVYLDFDYNALKLSTTATPFEGTEHDLAKSIARVAAGVCHTPTIESINRFIPLLFQAMALKHISLEKMFSHL